MSPFRPLPPRPNLEFEHKQAKAFLHRLQAGDSSALRRARERNPAIDVSDPARIRLADAQLVIAREYGFTSWPRLVRYFRDVERQRVPNTSVFESDFYESNARALIHQHGTRRNWAGRVLAAYVPRFYGLPLDAIFASAISEDEARLAIARSSGFPSWAVLMQHAAAEARAQGGAWEIDPIQYARKAIEAIDLDELERVVAAHPQLLAQVYDDDIRRRPTLLGFAFHFERRHGIAAMRPVMDWLKAHGHDPQRGLNVQLFGHIRMTVEEVQRLLERGADPNWVPPNGIPLLEYALLRYWNGDAVDVLAAHTEPREALWIAAGLGDVDGVRQFLDRDGKPTPAARRLRPDFDGVGADGLTQHPDPDDEEILVEAFLVAILNGRTRVVEYMVSRGFPVNSRIYETPLVNVAIGNTMVSVVESLIRGGADLDVKGSRPSYTARELARELFEQTPEDAERRRVAELCNLDLDAILRERDARPMPTPVLSSRVQTVLELAADDASRLGQSEIRAENLLFGLLRSNREFPSFFTSMSRMDVERFHSDVKDRMRSAEDRLEHRSWPMHADAQAIIEAALAIAAAHRRESAHFNHLLWALTQPANGAAADLIARYGGSAEALNTALEQAL